MFASSNEPIKLILHQWLEPRMRSLLVVQSWGFSSYFSLSGFQNLQDLHVANCRSALIYLILLFFLPNKNNSYFPVVIYFPIDKQAVTIHNILFSISHIYFYYSCHVKRRCYYFTKLESLSAIHSIPTSQDVILFFPMFVAECSCTNCW